MALFDSIMTSQDGHMMLLKLVDAIALFKSLLDFEFIIALHVAEKYTCHIYTESLT